MNKIKTVTSDLIGKTITYVSRNNNEHTQRVIGINKEKNEVICIGVNKDHSFRIKPTQIKHIY
uniref:Uncharacterized protein n=1 Tax=Geladintestivirus 1 TaxID=3233133 RepID=A0AAU8MGH5_9CAUD